MWAEATDDEHVVEVTIARLRTRLGPASPCLQTIRRRGYRLATATWPTTPLDPFFNANTMDDIAEAERLAELDGG